MRIRGWQLAIMVLSALIAFPVGAQERPLNEGFINLTWYSPADGKLKGGGISPIIFPKVETSACSGNLTYKIGAQDVNNCSNIMDIVELTNNKEEEKIGDEKNPKFKQWFATKTSGFPVNCRDEKGYPIFLNTTSLKEGVVCTLEDPSKMTQNWDGLFLADQVDDNVIAGKAVPWNGSTIYCPDAVTHYDAYELMLDDKGLPIKEAKAVPSLVRRSTLEACSRVVGAYLEACQENLAAKNVAKRQTTTDDKAKITKKKMVLAQEWLTFDIDACKKDLKTEELWWEKKKNECRTQWNLIKNFTYPELKLTTGVEKKLATTPKDLKKKTELVENIVKQIQKTENKDWIDGTLNDFLQRRVEKTHEDDEYVASHQLATEEENKALVLVTFLRRRLKTISMANAIVSTKKFQVSNWLRRNSTSTETDLTLLEKNAERTNVFSKVIRLAMQIFGSLGVLLLIISGVMMVVSQGEETTLQKSKQTFIYTLIGLLIGFLSYTIVQFILEFLLLR